MSYTLSIILDGTTIRWFNPFDGSSVIDHYTLYYTNDQEISRISDLSFDLNTLGLVGEFSFYLTATNTNGDSVKSNDVTVLLSIEIPIEPEPPNINLQEPTFSWEDPSIPMEPEPPNISLQGTTISWEEPYGNGFPIQYYTLYDGNNQEITRITDLSFNLITLGLVGDFTFYLTATNINGNSNDSNNVTITFLPPSTVPSKPSPPSALYNNITNQINISWIEPNNNGANITNYIIDYDVNNILQTPIQVNNITTYNLTSPIQTKIYIFRIKAINNIGNSELSEDSISLYCGTKTT